MATRYREPGPRRASDGLLRMRSNAPLRNKYRYCEFKHLYFEIQKLINKRVVLSFKYEQLKAPEIRISLIKPLVQSIVDLSNLSRLKNASNHLAAVSSQTETPQLASAYGSMPASDEPSISTSVIYVLLLLKYEFMIQCESNLLMYDLLTTKATICELLAIRLLREYSSTDRINLLFINPMSHHQEYEQLKHTKHLDSFNTLELSILSKSKKFLSQPVVVGILDRVYNGELILKDQVDHSFKEWPMLLRSTSSRPDESHLPSKQERETQSRLNVSENAFFDVETDKSIVNYKYSRVTIRKVLVRANVVPKYQSLVINLKYAYMTIFFLILVVKHRISQNTGHYAASSILSVLFWSVALSFNFDVIAKLLHIEYKFLKKIIWTYVDILIVILIDVSFILRVLSGFEKIRNELYYSCFSLVSILLFPRMLSVFNNYEFFHMIILSLKKMMWNVIALVCLFGSLIFGFFLCFISLTTDLSTYEVSYAMLKSFFGFTPAVWDNWDRYTNLGRAIQIGYLSLMQFVFTTILAIVLSNVFSQVSESNKEEFEYFKTTNLIVYLKWARLQSGLGNNYRWAVVLNYPVKLFKLPIILIIYFYEILIKDNKMDMQKQRKGLKHFTFLNREEDLYGDSDMMVFNQVTDTDADISSLRLTSRNGSQLGPSRVFSADETNDNSEFPTRPRRVLRKLATQESHQTLMGFRSGSLDSMFMDEFLGRKYGFDKLRTKKSETLSKRVQSEDLNKTRGLMAKLEEIEEMLSQLVAKEVSEADDFAVRELGPRPRNANMAPVDSFDADATYEINPTDDLEVDSGEFTCSDSE